MKWYGSICNRIEENKQFVPTIEVGQGVTEYSWSDRDAYEVVEVKDQKHITIRAYDHKLKDGTDWYSQDWKLISNPNNPTVDITKRGKYWYTVHTYIEDGKPKKHYNRMNISIGHADYYRDPSF
jgi:hypothetical protein